MAKDNSLLFGLGFAVLGVAYWLYSKGSLNSILPANLAPANKISLQNITPSVNGKVYTHQDGTALDTTSATYLNAYLTDVLAGRTLSSGTYAGNASSLNNVYLGFNSWDITPTPPKPVGFKGV